MPWLQGKTLRNACWLLIQKSQGKVSEIQQVVGAFWYYLTVSLHTQKWLLLLWFDPYSVLLCSKGKTSTQGIPEKFKSLALVLQAKRYPHELQLDQNLNHHCSTS